MNLVYLLLRYGAHVQTYSDGNLTPLLETRFGSNKLPIMHLLLDHGGYDTFPDLYGYSRLYYAALIENDYQTTHNLLQHGSSERSLGDLLHRASQANSKSGSSLVTLFLCYGFTNTQGSDKGYTLATVSQGETNTVLEIILPALENGDISRALHYTDPVTAGCMALGQGYPDASQRIYNCAQEGEQLDILLHAHILLNLCNGDACGRVLDHKISSYIHEFVNTNTTNDKIPKLLYRMADELHSGNIIIQHVRKIHDRYVSYVDQSISNKFVSDLSKRMRAQEATLGEMEFVTDKFTHSISTFRDTTEHSLASYFNQYIQTYAPESIARYTKKTGNSLLHVTAQTRDPRVTTYAPTIAYHVIAKQKDPYNYASQKPLALARLNENTAVSRILEQWRLLADCDLLCQSRGTRSNALKRLLYTMSSDVHHPINPGNISIVSTEHDSSLTYQAYQREDKEITGLPPEVRKHIIEFAHDITDDCTKDYHHAT